MSWPFSQISPDLTHPIIARYYAKEAAEPRTGNKKEGSSFQRQCSLKFVLIQSQAIGNSATALI